MQVIDIASIANILSALFLLGLLYIYVGNYRRLKTNFCLGLIFFALILLLQNLVSIYFQATMMDYYTPEVAGYALILNILEAIGLAALFYVTWNPKCCI